LAWLVKTAPEIAMLENQTIKEVRVARQKISEQHGHDLVRLVDHYKKLQREKLESQARKEATARVAEAPEG
jgi:(p)ppGpp synthase/HD superfamily hydrolase